MVAYCGDSSSQSSADVLLNRETLARVAPADGDGSAARVLASMQSALDEVRQSDNPTNAGLTVPRTSMGPKVVQLVDQLSALVQSWLGASSPSGPADSSAGQPGDAVLWIGPPDARPLVAARCAVLLRRRWIRDHTEAAVQAARSAEQARLQEWASSEKAKGRLD